VLYRSVSGARLYSSLNERTKTFRTPFRDPPLGLFTQVGDYRVTGIEHKADMALSTTQTRTRKTAGDKDRRRRAARAAGSNARSMPRTAKCSVIVHFVLRHASTLLEKRRKPRRFELNSRAARIMARRLPRHVVMAFELEIGTRGLRLGMIF
jgi:hypothetical protein